LANFAAHAIIKGLQPRLYGLLRSPGITTVKSILRLARFYIMVTLFLSISVGLFTPTIVELIAGSAYRIDRNTTVLLVIGGLFGSWYLFISHFIHFYERTFYISAITTISAIMQIFLCYLLVSNYGINGASIAYATTNLIMFILTLLAAIVVMRKHMETCE
jgi:O-antigen/teichoic acid export membrane protein